MIVVGLILIAFGACAAFFGYQIYRIFVFFQGLITGIIIGGILGNSILLSLLFGIVVGIMGVVLLRLGVFLQCFASGFGVVFFPLLVQKIMGYLNWRSILEMARDYYFSGEIASGLKQDITTVFIIALVVGVIIGLIGLIFTRIMITVITALAGGAIAGFGILALFRGVAPQIAIIFGIVLAIGGIVYQYSEWKKKKTVAMPAMQQAVVPMQQAAVPMQQAAVPIQPIVAEVPVMPAPAVQPGQELPKVRYCGQCGTQMSDIAKFCPRCGKQQ